MVDIPINQQSPNPSSLAVKLPKIVFIVLLFFVTLLGLVVAGDYFKLLPFSDYASLINNPFQKPEIKTKTEVSGITLTIIEKEMLMRYLEDYGIFHKNGVRVAGRIEKATAKILEIIIIDDPVDEYPIKDNNGAIRYSGRTIYVDKTNTLVLQIYFSPQYLSTSDNNRLSQVASSLVLYMVYDKTKGLPFNKPNEAFNVLKEVSDEVRNGVNFLQIIKT